MDTEETVQVLDEKDAPAILSQDDKEKIVLAFARGRDMTGLKGGVFTEDEASSILQYAAETMLQAACLSQVLSGNMVIDLNAELGGVTFILTEQGVASIEESPAAAE